MLENFTPRVMENFGLTYDVLRRVNPRLVMVSFSGYGRTGPYRNFKANGATTETIAGWVSLFGYPGEPPALMGEMEADPVCGLQMAAHALVALADRDQTGIGQQVDGSMFEAAVGYIGEEILSASLGHAAVYPRGNRDRVMTQGVFPCSGDDEWVAITLRDDRDWRALGLVASDAPQLRDARFATTAGRLAHVDEVEQGVATWTRRRPARAIMAALQSVGVPAAVVLKTDAAPRDPHFLARGWFRPLTHADMGTHFCNGYPWRFSRSPLAWRLPPPRLGEQSEAILLGELGLTDEDYAELVQRGEAACVLDQPLEGLRTED